jgi:hypothetical protein
VIDFALPLSILRRHRCACTSALIDVSSRRGFSPPLIVPPSGRVPSRISDVAAVPLRPLMHINVPAVAARYPSLWRSFCRDLRDLSIGVRAWIAGIGDQLAQRPPGDREIVHLQSLTK